MLLTDYFLSLTSMQDIVNAICDDDDIKSVSNVGSDAVSFFTATIFAGYHWNDNHIEVNAELECSFRNATSECDLHSRLWRYCSFPCT